MEMKIVVTNTEKSFLKGSKTDIFHPASLTLSSYSEYGFSLAIFLNYLCFQSHNSAHISTAFWFSSLACSYFTYCKSVNVDFISWFEINSSPHPKTITKPQCHIAKGATTEQVTHNHLPVTIPFDWKSKSYKTLNGDSYTCFIHNFVLFKTNDPSDFNHTTSCSYRNQFRNKNILFCH